MPFIHLHNYYAYGNRNGYTPDTASRSLDGVYVDGISITSGNPRKHVWTYAATASNNGNHPQYNCPCAKHPGPDPPTLLEVTTIVMVEERTHYGIEQDVNLKTVAAMMLECHGSSANFL